MKELYVGAGTIFIGPTATLGNDANGIMQTSQGFASPTVVLGASIPGGTGVVAGGVQLGLSGTTGPITYQHVGPTGAVDGPIQSLANMNDALNASAFIEIVGPTAIAGTGATATLINSTTITPGHTGQVWASSSAVFSNSTASEQLIHMSVRVNGVVSPESTFHCIRQQGANNGYVSATVQYRTSIQLGPTAHIVETYAWAGVTSGITVQHCDTFAIANLT